jgi:hypothetical protein
MDARSLLLAFLGMVTLSATAHSQLFVGPRAIVQSANFLVYAKSDAFANEVARVAEANRKQLAIHWLGRELPNWPEPCPLIVNDGARTPASGETRYILIPGGGVADFNMSVSGTKERILDSVLPHEITHTIMASHFAALGKPIPRWADEGTCTTVEHLSERSKHDHMLVQFLSQGKGIPFATLFTLKDYPPEMLPLYAQGYSLTCFLIAQGGPRRFVQFLERGMQNDDWVAATDEYYQYPRLGKLQTAWNDWVSNGGGVIDKYTADARGVSTRAIASKVSMSGVTINNGISNGISNGPSEVQTASAIAIENKVLHPSTGSYYLDQLRLNQHNASAANAIPSTDSFVPAPRVDFGSDPNGMTHIASPPPPFEAMGGETIRR